MNTQLINRQKEIVAELMERQDPNKIYSYHDWRHVDFVIASATELSADLNLDEELREDLVLAAIWHDSDYGNGPIDHEVRSAALAAASLTEAGLSHTRISRIKELILVTKKGSIPMNELEKLIRDADLAHLGSEDYKLFYDRLYQELKNIPNSAATAQGWKEMCTHFMESHEYHTPAAKARYESTKIKNLHELKSQTELIMEKEKEDGPAEGNPITKEEKRRLKAERKKNKPNYNAEKGIETMFRISLKNHITLSRIADDKANTLISVNAIILSIVLSALFPKLDSNPWLIYPSMALMLVSITTIVLSTLSTIPRTTHGEVSAEDIRNKRGNLLFFGNFHGMSLKEYEFGIGQLMNDGEYLYGSLTRDLYFLGIVLNRKYGMLRWAYLVFVIGLIVSIFLFVFSLMSLAPETTLVD
jgi:predicted metal-dependent HD superfamily phosphohydrolase